jgi:thioredoxin reductase (NADPH)
MCQAAYQIINKYVLKYTTVAGVDGFDGRAKKPKAVVKAIV